MKEKGEIEISKWDEKMINIYKGWGKDGYMSISGWRSNINAQSFGDT